MNNKILAMIVMSCSLVCFYPLFSMKEEEDISMNISPNQQIMSDEDDNDDMSGDVSMKMNNDKDAENDEDLMDEDYSDYEDYDDYLNDDYEDYDWNDEDWNDDYSEYEDEDELPEQNHVVETEEMMPQGDVNEDDDTRM